MCHIRLLNNNNNNNNTNKNLFGSKNTTSNKISLYYYNNRLNKNNNPSPEDDCGRGTTFHTYHRMGHDGQDKILSTKHALIIFSSLLSLSPDCHQNEAANSTKKSHVHWQVSPNFKYKKITNFISKKT